MALHTRKARRKRGWSNASVFGLDGAEAGPGEGGHLAGDLVRVELVTELDQSTARTLGQADEGMGERLAMLLVDVDGDQRGDRRGGLGGDLAHRVVELLVAARAGAEQEAERVVVLGDPSEVRPESEFGLALAVGGLGRGLGDVAEQAAPTSSISAW